MSVFIYVTASADDKVVIFKQDPDSGALEKLDEVDAPGRPAPMVADPKRRFLYLARRDANQLSTYRIDPESGGLSLLGDAPLESDPCFLATDRTGRWLFSAYYQAGIAAVHPINEDGVVTTPPTEWRETAGGAHAMLTDRSNRFAFVPHIGEGNGPNTIFQFLFDEDTGKLTPNDTPTVPQDGRARPTPLLFSSVAGRPVLLERARMQRHRLPFRSRRRNAVCLSDGLDSPAILERTKHMRADSDQSGGNKCCSLQTGATTASPVSP